MAKGKYTKHLKKVLMQKSIDNQKFFFLKLNYIHLNPVRGNYRLVNNWRDYEHSSASFYELQQIKHFTPVHYMELVQQLNAGSPGFAQILFDEDPALTPKKSQFMFSFLFKV
jgi:hypothetical protein